MLGGRSIANQVSSSVAYYPKRPTSRGITGQLETESATTKAPCRGTSLGLALAYTIIGSHDGGMVVQIQAGQGC
ncbi:hypothetical protein DFAR_2300013 [Desulfarculales bacterium]